MSLKSIFAKLFNFGKKSSKEEEPKLTTHRPTYPTYPEVEKPEVEKMTERLIDVSSKPLTLVTEEKSVKAKTKSVKSKSKVESTEKPKKATKVVKKPTKK